MIIFPLSDNVISCILNAVVNQSIIYCIFACWIFPFPLQEPKSILVYLITAGLGFGFGESLWFYVVDYVKYELAQALTGEGIQQSSSSLVEVMIIHVILVFVKVICSTLQAANYSRVSLYF